MGLDDIAKAWEPTEENYRKALGVLRHEAGMAGYPGPEVGSLIWAARIVSDFDAAKVKDSSSQLRTGD